MRIRRPTGRASPRPRTISSSLEPNAAAAAAAAAALGSSDEEIVRGLGEARPVGRRMRISRLGSGATLLDDCYNANPASMSAALATLRELADRGGGRALAVLGDMLELGRVED